jgi:hypothetical protein
MARTPCSLPTAYAIGDEPPPSLDHSELEIPASFRRGGPSFRDTARDGIAAQLFCKRIEDKSDPPICVKLLMTDKPDRHSRA